MPSLPRLTSNRRSEALDLARDTWRRAFAAMRRTPGLFMISLAIGAALWIFVTDVENPTIVDTFPQPIPVEAVNVEESLAVATQLPAIEVRLAAPQDRWEDLNAGHIRAYVDMRDRDARRQEVLVQVEIEGISSVRVVDTDPRTITVTLEDLAEAEVEVVASVIGTLPIGYELEEAVPEIETVRVSGPDSLVARVTQAAASVNVTGLTVGVDQTVPLQPQGAGGGEVLGVRLDPETARVRIDISQRTLARTVPLSIDILGEPDPGYRVTDVAISPSTARVEGPLDALQQLDRLTLPTINISGARTDVVRSVAIPDTQGVNIAGSDRATVTVSISPIEGSIRTAVPVETDGLSDGLGASTDPSTIEVVLEGPLPVLNALESGDLRAVLDLEGRGVGTAQVTPEIVAPDGVEVEAMQPGSVTVTIAET